jgi:hypothetical protein
MYWALLARRWYDMGGEFGWLWAWLVLAPHQLSAWAGLPPGAALASRCRWFCMGIGLVMDGSGQGLCLVLLGMALAWRWLACNWCWIALDCLAAGAALS